MTIFSSHDAFHRFIEPVIIAFETYDVFVDVGLFLL